MQRNFIAIIFMIIILEICYLTFESLATTYLSNEDNNMELIEKRF